MAIYTLRYATTRRELWRWYWRAWARPNGLWRYHVFIGAAVAFGTADAKGFATFNWKSTAAIAAGATVCCIALFPLWSQLKFKPEVRTLEIDKAGFKTSVGRYHGIRRWSEIRSVHDDGETIVLTTRQGAMLIPRRAFGDVVDRGKFIADIKAWHTRVAI